ncbi:MULTISPECIES: Na/Pi cotransporter family protein [Allobacillus]|uniref:Na/Pi cotransporter family protein n=1 Tax=Allobacillus halotolerans TaxID=570278 RepID=A0ABS6GL55_9BACI|nr:MULTISPECIES: Na/Pi cotransporter family protein [Allobacillus]MBU6079668.1 Na/Pi cotransporter family protein [Allobacillus halotolerans]TSJ68885.1 Na/Pi cotransporter family protein [Allobacillus sp. SKP2-8]
MGDVSVQEMIFPFIGGLGIFLFGIKYMGDGLQKSAGDKLREILDRFTTNPFMGVLAGIVVTVLIQTSTGTTVLTIGLVNAGFMTLRQAIGVIMGANIGTTVTAFIIGIDISAYALPIIAVGTLLLFFFKNNRINYLGQVFFGFGALFYGLELMGEGMKPLRTLDTFQELTVSMSEIPLLGVLVGTIFTVIVQSSSATIGILQSLHAEGAIELAAALPVLFGDNIGTTITAVIAAIGASVAAKRAAATHVIFNLVGATLFLILLPPFTSLISWMQEVLALEPKMTIAFAHGTFNITNTIIQFPFIALLAVLVTKIVPGEDQVIDYKPKHLDPIFIAQSPSVAINQAKQETLRMGELAVQGLQETRDYVNTNSGKHSEMAYQFEHAINDLDKKITNYLVQISSTSITEADSTLHSSIVNIVRDIERIGDHFENVLELNEYKLTNKVIITEDAMQDLNEMLDLTISTVSQALEAFEKMDDELADAVMAKENEIDNMEKVYRKNHILRLNKGICNGTAGIVFVDMISNLERIGDHASNVAQEVKNNH